MKTIDNHTLQAINFYAGQIEQHFGCVVFAYTGSIHPAFLGEFIFHIESLALKAATVLQAGPRYANPKRIAIILTTPGGIAEAVEKMVDVVRHHFEEVFFIVPLAAMSAGTIFCMSGDKIYMDYSSSLGPIDPQVENPEGDLVPALGYIDKVNGFINKSSTGGRLCDAEIIMLQRLDLATLRRYEQAKELSISLLEQWLVKYKFKDWVTHSSTGQPVTQAEKEQRARRIGEDLSNNNKWHSHGRMIGIDRLSNELRLKIEDYTGDLNLRQNLRGYAELLSDYQEKQRLAVLMHYSHA